MNEQPSRRERNKELKLQRIIAASSELFAQHGVDDVTTQQIAEAADIGAGTLFLYVKSKGELLLLVQNAHYTTALEQGRSHAQQIDNTLDAVLAILRPIVACNRSQIDNGLTYLREIGFGDPSEPHRAAALAIVAETESAVAAVLQRVEQLDENRSRALAHVVTAMFFLAVLTARRDSADVEEIVESIRHQLTAVLATSARGASNRGPGKASKRRLN